MFACGGGNICYNNVMNRVVSFLQKYFAVISVLIGISILLSFSFSNFVVTSNNHKAAEMYIGTLKYSMTIDGTTTNTLSVLAGETIIDVTIINENSTDTYYKLIYENNSNVTITYYEGYELDDSNNISNSYDSPNDKILNSGTKTLKLKITNNSTTSQTITFKITGGFATNTLEDVTVPTGYTIIEKDTSTNTYFCATTDTLTQGLQYVNGQYTYAFKQEGKYASSDLGWSNINNNGWGVQLTDKTSTDTVTSKVCTYINNKPIISMAMMFWSSKVTTLDVSNFNTSNVLNMTQMFSGSQAITLDLSGFDTLNVTNMSNMFSSSKAAILDLSGFNTSNVTNMNGMFYNSQATEIKGLSAFNTSNVINMQYMFSESSATSLDVSNFDTSNVTNMNGMFLHSQATTLDVSSFDTSKVTNMAYMFGDSKATTLDLSNFNTSKVTSMHYMFYNSKATTIDLSNFVTSNVTVMSGMFYNSQATSLDVSNFDTSKVTSMGSMFASSQATTIDVSNFDTSNVTDMGGMFNRTQAITIDLSKFNTSNVTNMSGMFGISQATTIDVSNFDTSNVTNMGSMFYYTKVTTLDLSSFDTSNVTDMSQMFNSSTLLTTIYTSDKFNTNNVTSSSYMFEKSTNLVGGAGTTYNSSYVDKTYAHIDGGTSNPGYFTDAADKPSTFPTDSWEAIVASVKAGNSRGYKVGDTKTIDMGTYGTHTLRIANTSTPSECSTTGFSQTACGFVLEFADIITTHNMNPSGTYKGAEYADGWNRDGWPSSNMHTFVNNDIYNALPSELKNIIINTTVVSGHGKEDTSNFTSTDKLYLLSTTEIWKESTSNPIQYDSAKNLTRQLDYYKKINTTTTNYTGAIKKYNSNDIMWFLRTANSGDENYFYLVSTRGDWGNNTARSLNGVSPAFQIG